MDLPGIPPLWQTALIGVGGLVVAAGGVLLALRGVRTKGKPDAEATAPAAAGEEASPAEPAPATAPESSEPESSEPENPEVCATDD